MVVDRSVNLSFFPLSTLPVFQTKIFHANNHSHIYCSPFSIFLHISELKFSFSCHLLKYFSWSSPTTCELKAWFSCPNYDMIVQHETTTTTEKHICVNTLFIISTNDWYFSRSLYFYYIGIITVSSEINSEFWVVIKWWNAYFTSILIEDIHLLSTIYEWSNVWITYNCIFYVCIISEKHR